MTKHLLIISTLCLSLNILLTGCRKADVEITADVSIIKAVDSLPCEAEIDYSSFTNHGNAERIYSDWHKSEKLHYDQYVTLKATGISNVSSITVALKAKGSTETKMCSGSICTVEVRKDLYN